MALQDFKDLGKQYVQDMRAKLPPSGSNVTHVVDKMLRNSWNVGYISMVLPQACIIQVLTWCVSVSVSCHASPVRISWQAPPTSDLSCCEVPCMLAERHLVGQPKHYSTLAWQFLTWIQQCNRQAPQQTRRVEIIHKLLK